MLTSVIDVDPLVEFAFIRDGVKLAALDGSEAGLASSAWFAVTDPVSAALPEAVSPSILRAEGCKGKRSHCIEIVFVLTMRNMTLPQSCFQRLQTGST